MKLASVLSSAVSAFLPKKSIEQIIEEQNTRTVWYPRVHGLPRKYVYGKRPGEPFMRHAFHPEGDDRPFCASETDPAKIARHSAICLSEDGSHGELCEMCRRLNNPKRFDLLVRLYRDDRKRELSGMNVSDAVENSRVNQSATSEYLKQLADLGLVRRERIGRRVFYSADFSSANPWVAEIARMIRLRLLSGSDDFSYAPIFRVMMGSFRSRVIRHVAAGGCGGVEFLRNTFDIQHFGDLKRSLRPAVDAHILDLDSDDPDGKYSYVTPSDPIARRIVELS